MNKRGLDAEKALIIGIVCVALALVVFIGFFLYQAIKTDSSTNTPINQSAQQSNCVLNSAVWSRTRAMPSEQVSMTVRGTNCNGRKLDFVVYRNSTATPTTVGFVNSVQFSNNQASAIWDIPSLSTGGVFAFIMPFLVSLVLISLFIFLMHGNYVSFKHETFGKKHILGIIVVLSFLLIGLFYLMFIDSYNREIKLSPYMKEFYFIGKLQNSNNISIKSNILEVNITNLSLGGGNSAGDGDGGNGNNNGVTSLVNISWPPQSNGGNRIIYSYSWPEEYYNGTGMSSLYTNLFSQLSPFYWVGAGGGLVENPIEPHVTTALQYSLLMPSGRKAMRFRNAEDWLFQYKNLTTGVFEDHCKNSTGGLVLMNLNLTNTSAAYLRHVSPDGYIPATFVYNTSMPCFSFENGENMTKTWINQFLSSYQSREGQLDEIVQDIEFEQSLLGYYLGKIEQRCLQNRTICPISWCEAIMQDPRFPPENFPDQFLNLTATVCNVSHPQWINYTYEYDTYLFDLTSKHMNRSIFDIAKQYYPSVKMSNYGHYHWNADYNVPYGSAPYYLYGNGAHVGTHQSPYIYGNLHESFYLNLAGLPNYSNNEFNSFKYHVNVVRSSYLSDSAPIALWITDKKYDPSDLKNTSLYQEMIIHAGLSGTEHFLYWSPYLGENLTYNDIALINSTLGEIQAMIGYQNIQYLTTNITPWYENYTYTGVKVGNTKVWRFTPINTSITSVAGGSLNGLIAVNFTVSGKKIVFPNATIFTPSNPISSGGYWVLQKENAPIPYVI